MQVTADATSVFPRLGGIDYPLVRSGEGVWLECEGGERVLDACSGGAMVASLGHGNGRVVEAAAAQAHEISYVYNHHFTNEPQERLAERLVDLVAPEMARVKFACGGSEANEAALRLARAYHVERGQKERWRVISPAQAYHGATIGALALTGRRALQEPYTEYLAPHLHFAPSTWRQDPSGQEALTGLDAALADAGPGTVAAIFCEAITGAALPAYSPPPAFWEGLAERRERHGFLICLDEVVTGMGRTGSWYAGAELPLEPDILTLGKGLGAGYAAISATLCTGPVFDAIAGGSRIFDLGHTWDGAPLPCAVGLAVLDELLEDGLVERVAARGPALREDLEAAVGSHDIVREVRGRGFLLGIELVDPRDGESILPDELRVAELMDEVAFEHGVLVTSTHSNRDGYTGDQTVVAPAFTATDDELSEMVHRIGAAVADVERRVKDSLS